VRPVLFSVLGIDIQTYGVSKILAALLGAYLLGRAFERRGLPKDSAHALVMWATIWGFVAAKAYYLLEQLPDLSPHDLGGMGFTWYGGLIGGVTAALVVIRRHRLPLGPVAADAAIPLTLAYGVGRLGCFFSGDGTYGRPSNLPWAMSFPNGVVATDVPVHPTPLYEALAAVAIAGLLLMLRRRTTSGAVVFGGYLLLSGIARFLVEFLRINEQVFLDLTQPQLWAIAGAIVGVLLMALGLRGREPAPTRGIEHPVERIVEGAPVAGSAV